MLHVLIQMFNKLYHIQCNIKIVAFIADDEVIDLRDCIMDMLIVNYELLEVV